MQSLSSPASMLFEDTQHSSRAGVVYLRSPCWVSVVLSLNLGVHLSSAAVTSAGPLLFSSDTYM